MSLTSNPRAVTRSSIAGNRTGKVSWIILRESSDFSRGGNFHDGNLWGNVRDGTVRVTLVGKFSSRFFTAGLIFHGEFSAKYGVG